jgi:hypothetical protein
MRATSAALCWAAVCLLAAAVAAPEPEVVAQASERLVFVYVLMRELYGWDNNLRKMKTCFPQKKQRTCFVLQSYKHGGYDDYREFVELGPFAFAALLFWSHARKCKNLRPMFSAACSWWQGHQRR